MNHTKVFVRNDSGENLVGIEAIPSHVKGKLPTIILVHGFAVTKEEGGLFDGLAESLADAGFAVYRFDFSGRGESEGDYSKTSLTKQGSDLLNILAFVKNRPLVDQARIGIIAQSFGTSATVALAPPIHALILMGTIAHPKDILGIPSKWTTFDPSGISTRVKSSGEVIRIGPQFWKDFEKHDLIASIKRIHCPTLFIHGSKDARVPITEMETLFEAANQPKEKIIIEGAEHNLNPCRDEVNRIAVEWFRKTMG